MSRRLVSSAVFGLLVFFAASIVVTIARLLDVWFVPAVVIGIVATIAAYVIDAVWFKDET